VLKAYCTNGGTGVDCGQVQKWQTPPALTYDHRLRDWTVDASIAKRTDEDVNGIPTVDVGRGQTIIVVVTNTNPLLYTATPGEIKLQPIEQFSDLQKLAGLVGGNISALLAARANKDAILGMSTGPIKDAAEALSGAADAYIAGQKLADCVTDNVQRATNFVQAVELGRTADYPRDLPLCDDQILTGEAVRSLTPKLGRARQTLARRCVALPESVVALLAANPSDRAAVLEAVAKYKATTLATDCAGWHDAPNVVRQVDIQIVQPIENALISGSPSLGHVYAGLEQNFGEEVRTLASTAKGVKAAEDPLAKLVAALPAIGKAAENLDIFRERLLQNVTSNLSLCSSDSSRRCVSQSAVATFIVVPGGPSRVTRWESLHSRPIKIAADSPYVADVVARRSAVDTSYNLRSNLASIFDVGVSVTKTDLEAPTFGAVKGTDNITRVAIVDQESQSGKLALMLNIVPLRLWDVPKFFQPFGVQVGASTDTGKPALYWGVSYGFGKYVRVGWGGTSQRVTTLRDLNPLGSMIGSTADIRTRKRYENDHYWSLMVSIRALRLFSSN